MYWKFGYNLDGARDTTKIRKSLRLTTFRESRLSFRAAPVRYISTFAGF